MIELGPRPIHRRPYFFELCVAANLLLIHAILVARLGLPHALTSVPHLFTLFVPAVLGQLAAGVAIRCLAAWFRGGLRAYLRAIWTRQWLADSARMVAFATLMIQTYSWIKVMVPAVHPRLFDEQLWNVDQTLFFGLSPTVFFLNLFRSPWAMRAVDFTYAYVFFASINLVFVYFLSSPFRRVRVAFLDGNVAMWLLGAWLYMLIPSIGPAYRFPQVWLEFAPLLSHTHGLQALLMHNYQIVVNRVSSPNTPVNVLLGVAAFPSLHVAFLTYVFLWMRRLWSYGGVVFGTATFFIFLGSVVTGWHYLVDSLAGLVLAWLCFAATTRLHAIARWLRLREIAHAE